ncbi:ribonuclease H-like domain-containing protein [Tanacetum coccineum]|uniref:Ribonuclease H-like domain-containing protein n=1 Tax=Tanacetum coccineum TaxID=301880 RepID=A0ABQ4WGD0_9ASTR
MTPTSSPSYDFLDNSSNVISNFIRSSPITTPETNAAPTTITPLGPIDEPLHSGPTDEPITHDDPPNTPLHTEPHGRCTTAIIELAQQTQNQPTQNTLTQQTQQPACISVSQHHPTQNANPNPVSVHPMVTHFCVETTRPTQRLNLHVSSISPLPKSYSDVFNDLNWLNAMSDEYDAIIKNNTCTLVPRPTDANIVWWMFISQRKYATEILERAHMVGCNSSRTPVDNESKLDDDGDPFSRSVFICMISGDLNYRLLKGFYDMFAAGCPTTRSSTSCYCVFLGNNLLSWSSKRQPTLSPSSAEAEYRGVANAVAETCWLRNLLRELHTPLSCATLVYCDNFSVVYLSSNPVQHQRMKHMKIDIHFLRDLVAVGQVQVLHILYRYQYADIFTKELPLALFKEFHSNLSVRMRGRMDLGYFKTGKHDEFSEFLVALGVVVFNGGGKDDPTQDQTFSPVIGLGILLDRVFFLSVFMLQSSCHLGMRCGRKGNFVFVWLSKRAMGGQSEEVLLEIPEPALGINFARDVMQEKDRLSLVVVHSDSWLLYVASILVARCGFELKWKRYLF